MERTIQEKTELIEEKDLQVKMMKAQLTILADEIDSIKKKQKDSYGGLIPRNIVKTIRGGGKGGKKQHYMGISEYVILISFLYLLAYQIFNGVW